MTTGSLEGAPLPASSPVPKPLPQRSRTLTDRLLSAFPLVTLVLTVLVFYAVQAVLRKTPWVFTDELEWSQLSRSIAATGHAARRGKPIYFKSLYVYLIAPFWWFHTTTAGYAAVKYANVVIMCSAAIPTYLLARMLVLRRTAIAVAVLSISVPAMAYATSIISEVAAYPYYALCSWLTVRAFASGRKRSLVLAGAFCVSGFFVRQTGFVPLAIAFFVAYGWLSLTGPRGRFLRRNWSRGDTIGASFLFLGGLFLFNRVFLQHIQQWQFASQYYKNRMVDLGLKGGLSLAIGLGFMPVIAGFTSLRLPDRRGEPVYRAFVAWASASIVLLCLYTADKAAFLSTQFATLWEERNLIYLSPILLLGTAMVFEAKRISRRVFVGSTVFVLFMLLFKSIQNGFPYFEAPGSAIPAAIGFYEHWSPNNVRLLLFAVVAIGVGLVAFRQRRGVAPLALVLTLGWLLAGEICFTAGVDRVANQFRANLPAQLNWVDRASGGQPVTFLGQSIRDTNGLELTEFWNHSIKHVDSFDGTAPGPGPTVIPNIVKPDGRIGGFSSYPYVLAVNGVKLNGTIVASEPAQSPDQFLYKKHGPWRLVDASQQVYSDGWCPEWCSYTYYNPDQKGTLEIGLSRAGYNGTAPPAKITITVGTVRIDENDSPQLNHIEDVEHRTIGNLQSTVVDIPIPKSPVRVEVATNTSTIIPPSPADSRSLGAQVSFTFKPAT